MAIKEEWGREGEKKAMVWSWSVPSGDSKSVGRSVAHSSGPPGPESQRASAAGSSQPAPPVEASRGSPPRVLDVRIEATAYRISGSLGVAVQTEM
jgi:hypothetical protein